MKKGLCLAFALILSHLACGAEGDMIYLQKSSGGKTVERTVALSPGTYLRVGENGTLVVEEDADFRASLGLGSVPDVDATLRSNHTGTQDASTISDFEAAVHAAGDARYPRLSDSFTNPAWIASLAWGKLTGTPTTLAGYGIADGVPSSRSITTSLPLTGGGNFTGNLVLGVNSANSTSSGVISTGAQTLAGDKTWTGNQTMQGGVAVGDSPADPCAMNAEMTFGAATNIVWAARKPVAGDVGDARYLSDAMSMWQCPYAFGSPSGSGSAGNGTVAQTAVTGLQGAVNLIGGGAASVTGDYARIWWLNGGVTIDSTGGGAVLATQPWRLRFLLNGISRAGSDFYFQVGAGNATTSLAARGLQMRAVNSGGTLTVYLGIHNGTDLLESTGISFGQSSSSRRYVELRWDGISTLSFWGSSAFNGYSWPAAALYGSLTRSPGATSLAGDRWQILCAVTDGPTVVSGSGSAFTVSNLAIQFR